MYPPEENKNIEKSRIQNYETLKHFAKKMVKKRLRIYEKVFNCFSKT